MIAYFDTSALIPLVVSEPGSPIAERIWDQADRIVSVRLLYAEARAALAQARRMGRVDPHQLPGLVADLDALYGQLDRVEVDDALVYRAGRLADDHDLRGYDAVHLAALLAVADDQTVFACGDIPLSAAASLHGVDVATTSQPSAP